MKRTASFSLEKNTTTRLLPRQRAKAEKTQKHFCHSLILNLKGTIQKKLQLKHLKELITNSFKGRVSRKQKGRLCQNSLLNRGCMSLFHQKCENRKYGLLWNGAWLTYSSWLICLYSSPFFGTTGNTKTAHALLTSRGGRWSIYWSIFSISFAK